MVDRDPDRSGSGDVVISVEGVAKEYKLNGQRFLAVAGVSMSVTAGEVICIVGKTGCGKSTLLQMLLGLEVPTRGHIEMGGLSPHEDFLELRRKVAAVFQTDRLLPWRSVIDNAALGLQICHVDRDERHHMAARWLDRLGLGGWEDAYPAQLSGGMRQRVAIARALVVNPLVVLLDEAFGHLDEVTAERLRRDCITLIREEQITAIVITHNISEAIDIGDRIVVLSRPARVVRTYDLTGPLESTDRESLKQEIFSRIEGGSEAVQDQG